MHLQNKFAIIIPPQDIKANPGCLKRLAAGDSKAFQWIYKNYCGKVHDYALLITGDVQLSEDVVQEVFLKIWVHRAKLKNVENFNGYVHSIVKNYTLDKLRNKKREQCNLLEYSRCASETQSQFHESMEYKELVQTLKEAIKLLPPRQQQIYILRREHGWKSDYVARELEISTCTAKVHIKKATKSVRAYVSKKLDH